MDAEPRPDGQPAGDGTDESTEGILEALLVEDAELQWDARTGKPSVQRRPKTELDRTPDSA